MTTYDYNAAWQEVSALQKKGLPQDAISLVEEILNQATADQYVTHVVKATYSLVAMQSAIEPSKMLVLLQDTEQKILAYDKRSQALIYSFLATAYYSDYQSRQYQIYDRTDTYEAIPDDPQTWTSRHYYLYIYSLHQKALSFKSELDVDITDYDELITEFDDKGQRLRPTLYLLVASRAVDFYSSAQHMIVSNSEDYQWLNPVLMADTDQFLTLDIPSDSLQLQGVVMSTMQALEQYTADNNYRPAGDYLELERIKAVYRAGQLPNKDLIYANALKRLAAGTDDYIVTEAKYLLAGHLEAEDLTSTLSILDDLLTNYPQDLPAVVNAQARKLQLEQPTLSGTLPSTNYPNREIDLTLSHKNLNSCTYKVYQSSYTFRDNYHAWRDRDKFWVDIKKQRVVNEGEIVLQSAAPYQSVNTTAVINGLPEGQYEIMLTGRSATGQVGEFHASITVTRLAASFVSNSKTSMLLVVDRWTGRPMSNVKVDYYERIYNQKRRRNEEKLTASNVTDASGVSRPSVKGSYTPRLSYTGGLEYRLDGSVNTNIRSQRNPRDIVSVMTDRAIYRPGQMLHYKVLAVDVSHTTKEVFDRKLVKIELRDVNREEVYATSLTTNEYGSVSGSVALPSDGLPGAYYITASVDGSNTVGRRSIRVEEYKRPKFEVVLDSPTDRKVLDDSISVKGSATALAGPAISDAVVKYSVSRSSYRPWWRRWSRSYSSSGSAIVATGQTMTDRQGAFDIDFVASFPANQEGRFFNYTISVDITDKTGETRSTSKTLSLSSKAVRLTTTVPEMMQVDETLKLDLVAHNFANQPQEVSGEVVIHSLVQPQSYNYKHNHRGGHRNVNDYYSWPLKSEVLRQPFDTGKESLPTVDDLPPGTYRLQLISAVADTFEVFFVVIDFNGISHSPARLLYHELDQDSYQPSDVAKLSIAACDDVQIYYILERGDGMASQWLRLQDRNSTVEIPISESDRGSVFYKLLTVSNNRYFIEEGVIAVPYSNKQLTVELETWRDKILPGADEEWTLKVKGPKGDHVAAEVLAAMYDASLDQFTSHSWPQAYWINNRSEVRITSFDFDGRNLNSIDGSWNDITSLPVPQYKLPYLDWPYNLRFRGSRMGSYYYVDGIRPSAEGEFDTISSFDYDTYAEKVAVVPRAASRKMSAMNMEASETTSFDDQTTSTETASPEPSPAPVIRSDFRETVFFYPDLRTDTDGNVAFAFKMSEALTRWRSMFLAHTKDLKVGYKEQQVQTQKDLMIVGNSPRFLRAGDKISLTGKVSNLSEGTITGKASIRLINALTDEPLPFLASDDLDRSFTLDRDGNVTLAWKVDIPRDFVTPIAYEITAQAGEHTDGERHLLPTVTNRKLVTETMPMFVQGGENKGFVFDRLKDVNSPTLTHQLYAVEFTSNPIWYVLQALPTLQPKTVETSDYLGQRLYASIVGGHIVQLSPTIKQVFDQWQDRGSEALLSNLEKNQELKTTVLNETPWVRDAADETTQKRLIAAFFDVNKLSADRARLIAKLTERQRSDGGFPWCSGGRSNPQTTQRVLLNLGRLYELDLLPSEAEIVGLLTQAHLYHDEAMRDQYERMIKRPGFRPEDNHLTSFVIRYLQVQSLLKRDDQGVAGTAYDYYMQQIKKHWLAMPLTEQAIIGQILHQAGETEVVAAIVESLRQFSITSPELGMYWDQRGYQWSHLPIERQTEMIRLFANVQDDDAVTQLTLHLLQLKKTNRWPTSAGTTAAVHTFLMQKSVLGQLSSNARPVRVQVGNKILDGNRAEAGTMYTKQTFTPVKQDLANISVSNPNDVVAWGAAYWQYWEDLNKVTSFEDTPLKITKAFYRKVKSPRGDLLEPVLNQATLQLGDKLVSRIIIESDRPMSFVHMQDMRPSGVEPLEVLSRYTYKDGLAYYHATRDLSTDFYIDYLPKGKHVVEYDVFVSHSGDFSTGLATLQSYYAPEYSSHSQGSRINVE